MKILLLFLHLLLITINANSQSHFDTLKSAEKSLDRNSLRAFFGTYEFSPKFRMQIFSLNEKIYAQRIGDEEKFQIFPKKENIFFLKVMPAELEFQKSTKGEYDTLVLHQDGKDMKAYRILAKPYELYDTILHLDSLVYEAYNLRNLKTFMTYFAPDLEFYHDLTGLSNFKDNSERFKTNFSKTTIIRRELLKGSLEVYPINDFGAIEIGTHNFYQTEQGQPERLVAQPKFMHIWKKTSDEWKIIRIISYDH
ncbi:MAG: DUF4440 domain-containing protein [Leadbetterella sp.]